MISQLVGQVVSIQVPVVVLDVNGVGYEINAPMTTVFQLSVSPEPVRLFTHLAVREDAHTLYGFLAQVDRDWFRSLIKVNGVGPRMALAILSGLDAHAMATTIAQEQLSVLQKVPGVGKKTAERLVIELQDKCRKWLASESVVGHSATNTQTDAAQVLAQAQIQTQAQMEQDAQYALIALGYKPAEASKVIRKVMTPDATSEQLIKRALQEMVRA